MHMGEFKKFSLEDTYDRLINRSKGGYCIQLNGIFGWLLKQLNYEVTYHPAYVFNNFLGTFYRLHIHLILVVKFKDGRLFYTDVGTVRMINTPIEYKLDELAKTSLGTYKFCADPDNSDFNVLYRAQNNLNNTYNEWVCNY